MYIFILVLLGLLAVWAILHGFNKHKKSSANKRAAQAKHNANLALVNNWVRDVGRASSDTELLEIEELPYEIRKDFESSEQLEAARKKHLAAWSRNVSEKGSQSRALAIQSKEDDPAELAMLKVNLVRHPDDRALEILNATVESLEKEVRQWFEGALEAVRSGDKNQFFAICSFMTEEPTARYSKGITFDYPDDWFDLVAQNVENPSISDFAILNTDVERGAIRQLAAEALRDRSLTNAKIALAFCAISKRYGYKDPVSHPWREEIGDVLMAELAKMVAELHTEAGMFVHTESE